MGRRSSRVRPSCCGDSAQYTKSVDVAKRRRVNGPLGQSEHHKLPLVMSLNAALPEWALRVLMTPTHAYHSGDILRLLSPRAMGGPLRADTSARGAATLLLLHMGLYALQECGVVHNDVYHNTLVAPLSSIVVFDARLPDARGRVRPCVVSVERGVGWPRVFDFGAIYEKKRCVADALELACKAVIYNRDGGEREDRAMKLLIAANQPNAGWGRTLSLLRLWAAPFVSVTFE